MRNIKVSNKYDQIVSFLIGPTKHFKTMRDLYVFSANLGYTVGRNGHPEEPSSIFDSRLLMDNDFIKNSMYSLALADIGEKSILLDESQDLVAKTFESYLDGGLDLIKDYFDKNPSDTEGNTTLLKILQDNKLIEMAVDTTTGNNIVF